MTNALIVWLRQRWIAELMRPSDQVDYDKNDYRPARAGRRGRWFESSLRSFRTADVILLATFDQFAKHGPPSWLRPNRFYSTHPWMAEDVRERGIDLLTPVYNLLDLTPEGRDDWYAKLSYPPRPPYRLTNIRNAKA